MPKTKIIINFFAGFIQAHNLKVHMKVHEPSKWLPCEIINCKKKFVSEYARKRHQARHSE